MRHLSSTRVILYGSLKNQSPSLTTCSKRSLSATKYKTKTIHFMLAINSWSKSLLWVARHISNLSPMRKTQNFVLYTWLICQPHNYSTAPNRHAHRTARSAKKQKKTGNKLFQINLSYTASNAITLRLSKPSTGENLLVTHDFLSKYATFIHAKPSRNKVF